MQFHPFFHGQNSILETSLRYVDGPALRPTLDFDFGNGEDYCHRVVAPGAITKARASSALQYMSPYATDEAVGSYAELVGNNVLRYGHNGHNSAVARALGYETNQNWIGLLVEGADQNVIVENTQYAALNWTLAGGPTVTDNTVVSIYDDRNFTIAAAGAEAYMYQTALLTAEDYFICFLVNYGVGPLTDANVRIAAGVSGAIVGVASTHEMIAPGLWLVWGVFTATAANWDIGVNVRANRTVRLSLVTCCKTAPANEGGAFPRSPIPSGAAATTRVDDRWTVPTTVCAWDGNAATLDMEVVAPCSEAEAANILTAVAIRLNANNYGYLYINPGTDRTVFTLLSGGGAARTVTGAIGFSRGDILKFRVVWNTQATLDGTNYTHLYASVNNVAWALIDVDANAYGGTFVVAGATLAVGVYPSTYIRHWGAPIRRLRFYPRPIVGAGW